MATQITVSPQLVTGFVTLVVGILSYIAANASQIVSPQYSALVAFIASSVAAFITHDIYANNSVGTTASTTGATPPPTTTAAATPTVTH